MNYLVSMNVNDWMPPNVAESHAAAAERWGARYVVIKEAPDGVFAAKSMIWAALPWKREDRIAWVDGDAIVHEDCPSLFEEVHPIQIAGVRSIQTGNPLTNRMREYFHILRQNALDAKMNWDNYLNSGVYVLPCRYLWVMRAAWGLAESYRALVGHDRIEGGVEESHMNLAVYTMLPYGVRHLSAAFNRLGRSAWDGRWVEEDGSQNFILHLATMHGIEGDKRERLASIDWRAPVGVTE